MMQSDALYSHNKIGMCSLTFLDPLLFGTSGVMMGYASQYIIVKMWFFHISYIFMQQSRESCAIFLAKSLVFIPWLHWLGMRFGWHLSDNQCQWWQKLFKMLGVWRSFGSNQISMNDGRLRYFIEKMGVGGKPDRGGCPGDYGRLLGRPRPHSGVSLNRP